MASKDITEYMSSAVVEVTVSTGQKQKTYNVHESLLCELSDFCRVCLAGGFSEAASRKILLANDDPVAFDYFLRWAYSGGLAPLLNLTGAMTIQTIVPVYILADKLLCEVLQNRIIDMVQDYCTHVVFSVNTVVLAMKTGLTQSPLLQFLTRQLAYHHIKKNVKTISDDSAWAAFVRQDAEIVSSFLSMVTAPDEDGPKTDPSREQGCRWHKHSAPRYPACKRKSA